MIGFAVGVWLTLLVQHVAGRLSRARFTHAQREAVAALDRKRASLAWEGVTAPDALPEDVA